MEKQNYEKSILQVIRICSIHCNKHRGRAYDDRSLPEENLLKLGSSLIDQFERGFDGLVRRSNSAEGATADDHGQPRKLYGIGSDTIKTRAYLLKKKGVSSI